MSDEDPLEAAHGRLRRAMERLEQSLDSQIAREHRLRDGEAEIQRMTADRGRLAGELDSALARCERLEEANREVSRRLVNSMETVRSVLDLPH